ncbi:MAG: hypothetical protein V1816_19175 [Pseudomonadota bacterium]
MSRKTSLIGVLITGVCLMAFLSAPAQAQTQTSATIITTAANDYFGGGALNQIIDNAFASAGANLIPLTDLAAGLSDALFETGLRQGQNGVDLAGQIASAMVTHLNTAGLDQAESLRILNATLLGLRAAAARAGIDQQALMNQLIASLQAAGAGSTWLTAEVSGALVNGAFQGDVASTYVPPDAGLPGGLPAPSLGPPDGTNPLGGNYDPTASRS